MIKNLLIEAGIQKGESLFVHSSYSQIKGSLKVDANRVIEALKEVVSEEGSIVMPTFTYFFRKRDGTHELFDKNKSESKTGYLTEVFRLSSGVRRTTSPTHSFAIWGKLNSENSFSENPASPLGKESILTTLLNDRGKILMLGCGFESFTFGHYLENMATVPWKDITPWDYMGVEPFGVSVDCETRLCELPGCSKGFLAFESYLIERNLIQRNVFEGLDYYILEIGDIYDHGLSFFRNFPEKLICEKGSCTPCDARREKLKQIGVYL